ncbi:MAG: hypothetical protein O3B01_08010 [Planctomycetota bacterium]|nr:hypothetical protein [Planctomycetota bacterium]MDA1138514.1 hypothetical protein [Planctomycetota bacterium]
MNRTLLLLTLITPLLAQQREGAHIEEIEDQDGDPMILLDSEYISMYISPDYQSMVMRFVFRPSGNDILDEINPKFVMAGGGLLQDNFWEQDWRFSEFRRKYYDYEILKEGPDEVSVGFSTKSIGFIQSADSGVYSRLLTDIRLIRKVTLKADAPYFRFDLELRNEGECAKLPMMWSHNSCLIEPDLGDQVHRPSARGVRSNAAENFIYDYNHGWSAKISKDRKEGLVYLMDYDYINFMYNCGTTTEEWIYDNVLILKSRPWKSRIYILPVIGLSKVDYADPWFIVEIDAERTKESLDFSYKVTASYEKVSKITFNTNVEFGHLTEKTERRHLEPVVVEGLGVEPKDAVVSIPNPPADPVLLSIKAYIELPDGKLIEKELQHFHVGNYRFKDNIRQDLKTPVVRLNRPIQNPYIPVPKEDAKINQDGFRVFAMLGNHSTHLKLREAIRSIPKIELGKYDYGYTPGFVVQHNGLTDFPYDYERLFNYRTVIFANCQTTLPRRVGSSIVANYLKRGGGLVMTGGDSAFRAEWNDPKHEFDEYVPFKIKQFNMRKEVHQLNSPVADHPIFKDIDLTNLPYTLYYHDLELKPELPSKVLMKVGDKPFIVELTRGEQRTITVLCCPFGDPAESPGKVPYWEWPEWEKLFANIVRYAGHDL